MSRGEKGAPGNKVEDAKSSNLSKWIVSDWAVDVNVDALGGVSRAVGNFSLGRIVRYATQEGERKKK